MPDIDYSPDNPFTYFHECHTAVGCFIRYLADEWIIGGMGGIAGFNTAAAWPIIRLIESAPKAQLQLLEDIKAFATGVKQIYDQRQAELSHD